MENGNLHWIIPDKLMAFNRPKEKQDPQKPRENEKVHCHPSMYKTLFRGIFHVTKVINLNQTKYKEGELKSQDRYDKRFLTKFGVAHYDLYFPNGETPPEGIEDAFVYLCQQHFKN